MIRKLLLLVLLGMCSGYAALAQDPSASGVVINPNPIQTGQPGSITVSFGNGSSAAIPQSAAVTYTVEIPKNIGIVSYSLTVPTGSTNTTGNLAVTQTSSATSVILQITSPSAGIPGDAIYDLIISMGGFAPTSSPNPRVTANAAGTGLTATNVIDNDNSSAQLVVQGPMPVALVSFSAKAQEDHTVSLAWTTSLETNNKGFLVERSKDLKAFEKVGEVTELGANSTGLKNYNLADLTPYQGTSYYRLTQIDLNGKTTVFQDKIVSVVLRDGAYGVFPNPVISDQQFRLSLDEPETAQISFYGADGRVLPFQKVGVESGSLLLKVTGKLSTGVYILTVGERGLTRKHRLVVE
ncbi:T9SS type A sorting domain-containing protein [Spirosoma foliorum]|uniref:T9SS type A sorting domain-containing protein n=1 Tax=Spirosoma foliorum TaxID=2710596 RepID=A0A7G5GRV8_9BACT|nr:T9SS type A sorting domain-containing protein [Spirosoma foliorum]QMW01600.1 T9SS type A sorting domain-containing protein [Spirosoma foliorum]